MAWTHPGLRAIVRGEWVKHIVIPTLVLASVAFWPGWAVLIVYWTWNSYHFGMQNFGVLAMYDRRGWGFVALCATALAVSMTMWHPTHLVFIIVAILSLHHYLTDIWLSSKRFRWQWGFIALVLVLGVAWYCLRQGPLSTKVLSQIIAIGYGIGIAHFLYSGSMARHGAYTRRL